MKFFIIDGANINMIGRREPIYGTVTYAEMKKEIRDYAGALGIETTFFQSNHEGDLIDAIQSAIGNYDGLIINPGAFSHYSYAIADALRCCTAMKKVEVHLTDIYQRERFRAHTVTGDACEKVIAGKGIKGYMQAVLYLQKTQKP